jgi:AraC family transcriptional regulator
MNEPKQPCIETLQPKKLIGKRLKMTFANNRTFELFRSFMPERKTISNPVGNDIYCIQLYQNFHGFHDLKPDTEFEKWAALEVSECSNIPAGMESFTLTGGLYAVFHYVGSSSDSRVFEYIFKTWLPASEFELDQRPHFEILGEKYKNNDPSSEEHIWIPVKRK